MFKKILIANRGEIACRVMRTAKRMGIQTVAVYSDADDGALHMRMADEAVHIGASPAAQSYLMAEKIIAACKETGAEAVHPGYGFLSENTNFAAALARAGIAFIGPDPKSIAAMGDKIESKKLAKAAGVSTVPGYLGVIEDMALARRIAGEIGYPVMLKASAGGGGKGMRIARNDLELEEGLRAAQNEARAAFGDDRVFIEKYIEEPRHIEIQVLGDKHGNVIHLGERECSIQRRHQKVLEEAPSPFLDEQTRAAMGAQAVALARAVDYSSAGTVEFIVDKNRNFYFLEMNTRLQVEHPVTELVTGIDLVEVMIRVAAGEKLAMTQDQVRLTGWALEARIYAEDPYRGFLPSTGRLSRCRFPSGKNVRVDTGVEEGAEISPFYDPMIAKLCTVGRNREEAIGLMEQALDETWIDGIGHNVNFLNAVIGHARFQEGHLSTNFIAEEWPQGFSGAALSEERMAALMAIGCFIQALTDRRAHWSQSLPLKKHENDRWILTANGQDFQAQILSVVGDISSTGAIAMSINMDAAGHVEMASHWRPGNPIIHAQVNGAQMTARVAAHRDAWVITHHGAAIKLWARSEHAARLARLMPEKLPPDMSKFLLSPMPGLVVSIATQEGEAVKSGQTLAVIEAMKMENILRAEQDGQVKAIKVKPGESVSVDQILIEFA